MSWEKLVNEIRLLKEQYPENLATLYIIQDEQYVNKYMVWVSKVNELNSLDENDICETMTIIDVNSEYDYHTKYLIYMKTKLDNQVSSFYYNNVLNWLKSTDNWFVIDFVSSIYF